MSTASLIGFINAFILVAVIIGGVLKGTKLLSPKQKKLVRTVHKYAGLYLCIAPLIHAYMMLGGFRFHPGFILYGLVIINVILIVLAKKTKNKLLFKAHRYFPILILLVLFGHVFLQ